MDLLSILIIVAIAQGFFTIALIVTKGGYKKRGFWQLIALTLFLVWLLAEFLSIRWPFPVGVDVFYGTRFGSWLFLGPMFLSYVKIAVGEKQRASYLIHFLPFVILTLFFPILQHPELSIFQVDYGMLNVFNPFDIQYTFFQWLYSYIFIFQFLHLASYLLMGILQIHRSQSQLENSYSDGTLFNIYWLRRLCYYLLFALLIVIIFLVILFYTNIYRRHMDYLYVLPMSFLIYAVSFKLANASWPEEIVSASKKKYAKSSLTEVQSEELQKKLETYMKEEKPYLNNGLKLTDLSEAIGSQTHHLSQVINEQFGKTFFDYINEKRVEEAKSMIANEGEMNLLEVAFSSGFNNKNSFTNAFKKYTGRTPSSFKQEFHLLKN